MTIRRILHYPDPRLRRQANPVPEVTDDIRRLVDDMAETMYDAPGIGLAAIQVNEPWRLIVIDISQTRDRLQVFINPEILSREGEQELEEGCLSVPGIYEPVAGRRRTPAGRPMGCSFSSPRKSFPGRGSRTWRKAVCPSPASTNRPRAPTASGRAR